MNQGHNRRDRSRPAGGEGQRQSGRSIEASGGSDGRFFTVSFALLVVMSLLILSGGAARASGLFLPLQGIRATGRAGATVVEGGGPWAIWYNPAALAELEGWHITADLVVNRFGSSFLRAPSEQPNGDLLVYPEVHNSKGPDLLPSLIATWDLGLERITVGLGLFPPMGYRYNYPLDGPQRYSAVENGQSLSMVMELAVAVQILDWLSVGAGFQNIYFDSLSYTIASAWPGVVGQPEDSDWDALLGIHLVDPFTPTGNVGVVAEVYKGLELGLSVQLPARIEDRDATVEMRLPLHPLFDSAQVSGQRVISGFNLPTSIRSGVRYHQPTWDVELNVVWQDWSVHDAITFEPQGIVLTGLPAIDEFVVRPVEMVMGWEDTISVHLGGEVEILRDLLKVRGGLLYEQSAIPDQRLNVFQMDLEKVAPCVGLTLLAPRQHLAVDLAYTHLFLSSRRITDSLVVQSNTSFEEGAVVVGNGDYSGSFDLFGLGVEVWF